MGRQKGHEGDKKATGRQKAMRETKRPLGKAIRETKRTRGDKKAIRETKRPLGRQKGHG